MYCIYLSRGEDNDIFLFCWRLAQHDPSVSMNELLYYKQFDIDILIMNKISTEDNDIFLFRWRLAQNDPRVSMNKLPYYKQFDIDFFCLLSDFSLVFVPGMLDQLYFEITFDFIFHFPPHLNKLNQPRRTCQVNNSDSSVMCRS